ncbi:MAG: hypothetical protein WA324_19890 [Bryobacteraceae bacterium]
MLPDTETFDSTVHPGVKVTVKRVTTALRHRLELADPETRALIQEVATEFIAVAPDGNIPTDDPERARRARILDRRYVSLNSEISFQMVRECLVRIEGLPEAEGIKGADLFGEVGLDDAPLFTEIAAHLRRSERLGPDEAKNSLPPTTLPEQVDGRTNPSTAETVSSTSST